MDIKSTKWNYHPLFKALIFVLLLVFLYYSIVFSIKSFEQSSTGHFSTYERSYRFSQRVSEIINIMDKNNIYEPDIILEKTKHISNNFNYALVDDNYNMIVGTKKEFILSDYTKNSGLIIAKNGIYDMYEKHTLPANEGFSIYRYYDNFKNYLDNNSTLSSEIKDEQLLYISIGEELPSKGDSKTLIQIDIKDFEHGKKSFFFSTTLFFVLVIMMSLCFFYLNSTIGYRYKGSDVVLIWFDYIPFEIQLLVSAGITIISFAYSQLIIFDIASFIYIARLYMLVIGMLLFTYLSWIRKIKAKSFINYSILPKFIQKFFTWSTNAINSLLPTNWKNYHNTFTILYLFCYTIINVIFSIALYISYKNHMGFTATSIVLIATFFNVFVAFNVSRFMQELKNIVDYIANLKNGNIKQNIDSEKYSQSMSEVFHNLNELSKAIQKNVDKQMKAERMRTDLITNVSHDLKTPLTSIINYIDLLSKQNINSDESDKYIAILSKQSNRLKSLITQLVDASKYESGNVNIDINELNLCKFMNQISGEYADSFSEKNLELVYDCRTDNVIVKTDINLLYRLVENLMSNAKKYSLEHTRVYINIYNDDENTYLEFKNTSKYPLNISSDELMDRFVRADSSRTSDGNGLGLAISRSIAKLLNIDFEIIIDGDLFKAVVILARSN